MAETRVIVEVAPGLNQWAWSDPDDALVLTAGGRTTLKADELSDDALRAIGAAAAAGSLILHQADAASRKTIEASVESDTDSMKALDAADRIRAELLEERDRALDDLAAERAAGLDDLADDDADARKDELARYNAYREQILSGHDERVDEEIRARVTEKDGG